VTKGKILVLEPHSDDLLLGCGGATHRLAERGYEIFSIVLTDSISAEIRDMDPETVKRRIEERKKMAERTNALLGVKKTCFLGFADMQLDTVPHLTLNQAIEDVIKTESIEPLEILFIPWRDDWNVDHQLAYQSGLVIGRRVNHILCYETPSTVNFTPNLFRYISKDEKLLKMRALQQYGEDSARFQQWMKRSTCKHCTDGFCEAFIILRSKIPVEEQP
jgi:N-acetylglucosamine malate deacetylase 1